MRRSKLFPLVGLTALATACGPAELAIPPEVDCELDASTGQYVRQVTGGFTPADLDARGAGEAPIDQPGRGELIEGYYSFWSSTVETVPFDHPANVVCQALLFDDSDSAEAFVEGLDPSSEVLSRSAMGWPKEGDRHVSEATWTLESTVGPTDARAFVVSGPHRVDPQRVAMLFQAVGRYVVSVQSGGPAQEPDAVALYPVLERFAENAAEYGH